MVNAIAQYKSLYKKKYGIEPEVVWDDPWYRIGSSPGVRHMRFKQLISQLSY